MLFGTIIVNDFFSQCINKIWDFNLFYTNHTCSDIFQN